MSDLVRKEAKRFYTEVYRVYSQNNTLLTKMVKALYREFQESLGPTDKVLLMEILPGPANLSFSKDGVIMGDGKVISAEQYVERIIGYDKSKYEVPNDVIFKNLMLLINQIEYYEETTNKLLTGKYLKKETKKTRHQN